MSEQNLHFFQTYIKLLEEHAKPATNDARYMSYVKYFNAFLSCFGEERIYLVGSTGERLKLRRLHNDGDADFIMCTGKLEIPIKSIEERSDLRCYVRIRADNLRQDICGDLIDGYLSADLLRELRPELFTFLRAIHSVITTSLDYIPGKESRVTAIAVPMKVGLGITSFRNLDIEGDILGEKRSNKRLKVDRNAKVAAKLKERWQNVQLHTQDIRILQRILKILKSAKVPGRKGEKEGQLNKLADDIGSLMERIPLEQEQLSSEVIESSNNKTEADFDKARNPDIVKMKAIFSDMSTKDFVPAVKVIGDRKLNCLVEWKNRVDKANWPPRNIAEEIFNTDVFLVARDAPMKPDHHRDFCYSFNLAELKLADCLSSTQRRVYLILKSYLSGRIKRLLRGKERNEKTFKTYFLKTAFFWVCEREDSNLWKDQNIIAAVKKVLHFIQKRLQEKKLSHYFVNSNLFVELEDLECEDLESIIKQIKCEPINSIGDFEFDKEICKSVYNIDDLEFIKWDDSSKGEIWLDQNEVHCLSELKEDGGRIKHLDTLEDALIDMQRGFNESPRDDNGNVSIKEAVNSVFDVFIDEERQKQISDGTSNITLVGAEGRNTPQAIPGINRFQTGSFEGLLNSFVPGGGSEPIDSHQSKQGFDLLDGLGSFFQGGRKIIASLGGKDGIRNVLQQTADPSVDPLLELKNAVGKYLSCRDEDEEALLQKVKHKVIAYFVKKKMSTNQK